MALTLSNLRRNSDLMSLKELRRKWGQRKQSCIPCDPGGISGGSVENGQELKPSLPLLQVWPSQDSPRGEGDGESFVFPTVDNPSSSSGGGGGGGGGGGCHNDSGIGSVQASPCCPSGSHASAYNCMSGPSTASSFLHPDRARLMRRPSSPEQHSLSLDESDASPAPHSPLTPTSSMGSSLNSVAAANAAIMSHLSRERDQPHWDRRRSSTMTARYSLLDALDLEYALIRAAARGSIGPYSLSESVHKLTFTQSLAFPGLARGLAANKRRRSSFVGNGYHGGGGGGCSSRRRHGSSSHDSGLNAFAKIITALVLVLVSVMVFGVVYKFVKT